MGQCQQLNAWHVRFNADQCEWPPYVTLPQKCPLVCPAHWCAHTLGVRILLGQPPPHFLLGAGAGLW
jgi:hypothetical protein